MFVLKTVGESNDSYFFTNLSKSTINQGNKFGSTIVLDILKRMNISDLESGLTKVQNGRFRGLGFFFSNISKSVIIDGWIWTY